MQVRQQQKLLTDLRILEADATRVAGAFARMAAHRAMPPHQRVVGELEERFELLMIDAHQLERMCHVELRLSSDMIVRRGKRGWPNSDMQVDSRSSQAPPCSLRLLATRWEA